MKREIEALLERAQASLDVAETILAKGEPGFASSRAYYSMFYCAQALLLSRGLSYSSHSGVLAVFGQQFAKSGLVDPRFHRYLIEAYRTRQVSD